MTDQLIIPDSQQGETVDTSTLDAEIVVEVEMIEDAKAALENSGYTTELFYNDEDSGVEEYATIRARRPTDTSIDTFRQVVENLIAPFDGYLRTWGHPFHIPSPEAVLAAIGSGANVNALEHALKVDDWTIEAALKPLLESGQIHEHGGWVEPVMGTPHGTTRQ